VRELLIKLLRGKEEAERSLAFNDPYLRPPCSRKAEFVLSILSGISSERDVTALRDPEAIIRELKKTRQKLWEEKYKNWLE